MSSARLAAKARLPSCAWKGESQPETVQNVAANLRKAASQRALGLSVRLGYRIAWNLFPLLHQLST
jgi:hypothetical protein